MATLFASDAIIEPKTAAGSGTFTLSKSDVPARITATGLAGAEKVTIKSVDGPSSIETAVSDGEGAAMEFTATDPVGTIYAPGPYKVTKTATAGASGVFVAKG